MKKIVLFLLCALLLLNSFIIIASAHSGKTDSNGGHYDSSTGSYHYHHGYPAHSHAGGVCPYSYDDKTNHSSSSSSNSSKGYSSGSYSNGNHSNKTVQTKTNETSKEQELPGILRFLICVGAAAVLAFLAFFSHEKDEKARSNGDRRSLWGILFYFSVVFLAIFIFIILTTSF